MVLSASDQSVKGYEITIQHFKSTRKSCLQIMSTELESNTQRYTLRIKDPSFVTIMNEQYTFYFGQVYVRALMPCDQARPGSDELCASIETSNRVEVGIKKSFDLDLPNYKLSKWRSGFLRLKRMLSNNIAL